MLYHRSGVKSTWAWNITGKQMPVAFPQSTRSLDESPPNTAQLRSKALSTKRLLDFDLENGSPLLGDGRHDPNGKPPKFGGRIRLSIT